MPADYPSRIDIVPWGSRFAANGTWVREVNVSSLDMGWLRSGSLITDYVEWQVLLKSGTWTLTTITQNFTNRGIATASLGGVAVGTIDTYAAGATQNAVGSIAGIVVSASGVLALRLATPTKNASSSNYEIDLIHLTLQRTGA